MLRTALLASSLDNLSISRRKDEANITPGSCELGAFSMLVLLLILIFCRNGL